MDLLRLENVNSLYGRSHILFDVYIDLKAGETFLDLGSGAGIDVFIAAKKVVPSEATQPSSGCRSRAARPPAGR